MGQKGRRVARCKVQTRRARRHRHDATARWAAATERRGGHHLGCQSRAQPAGDRYTTQDCCGRGCNVRVIRVARIKQYSVEHHGEARVTHTRARVSGATPAGTLGGRLGSPTSPASTVWWQAWTTLQHTTRSTRRTSRPAGLPRPRPQAENCVQGAPQARQTDRQTDTVCLSVCRLDYTTKRLSTCAPDRNELRCRAWYQRVARLRVQATPVRLHRRGGGQREVGQPQPRPL